MKSPLLLTFLAVLFVESSLDGLNPPSDPHLMKVPIDCVLGEGELIVSRNSELRHETWTPPGRDHPIPKDVIYDRIEMRIISPDTNAKQPIVWSKTHQIDSGFVSFQRVLRLVFYDAECYDDSIWVLYSSVDDLLQSTVYLDQIVRDEHGAYQVKQFIPMLTQRDSGFTPYLIEQGKVFQHEESIYVAFKTRIVPAREHPYEIWSVAEGVSTKVEDASVIDELRRSIAPELEKEGRPSLSDQIKPPTIEKSD